MTEKFTKINVYLFYWKIYDSKTKQPKQIDMALPYVKLHNLSKIENRWETFLLNSGPLLKLSRHPKASFLIKRKYVLVQNYYLQLLTILH